MASKMKQVVEEVKEQVLPVVEEAKEQVMPVVEKAVEQAKPVVEEAKKRTRKAAEKTVKTAAKAKDSVEKAAKKVVTGMSAPTVYVQYMGEEENVEDLVAAAKAAFALEHPRTEVEDLRLYIKPEERAAYYVINEKFAGKVDF
ncbi:MAG: DUF6465 family protein [Oscillospiraceae bacterium]|nr:DUF6465 family protein [Oscillospiraceae bacterium]